MDEQVRTAAAEAARRLLLDYRTAHPHWTDDCTPIDDLVSWLDLHVETFHPEDYPQGTYGFLEADEDLIWLCRDLPETLRRFTLAHELGHAVLHSQRTSVQLRYRLSTGSSAPTLPILPEDPCQQPDVQEEITTQNQRELLEEVLGIGQTYDPRSERELAANIFAAELLMPIERVRALYLSEPVAPSQLVSVFGVSHAAMLNRLVGLLAEHAEEAVDKHEEVFTQADSYTPEDGRPQGPSPHSHAITSPPERVPAPTRDGFPASDHTAIAIPQKQYDEFQRAAIEAATPALVVAGPGSGKTSTLIGRVEYLITEQRVEPEHILALTFSRKAAQEMQERLERVLHSQEDDARTGHTSMPAVSTFHAFCAELLREHGEQVGLRPDFALIDETEGYFLLRQLAQEMRLTHYRNLAAPAYYFPAFLKAISRAKDELVTPARYQQLAQAMRIAAHNEEDELKANKALEVAHIYALYEQGLRKRGDTDFGGLIMLAVQLLQEFPEVRTAQQQRFAHILVDEFQDINRASGVLLRLLAGEQRNVWVVGDANQAIYGFRGASPANIANFQEDYPGARVLPLSRNYRSRPDIVSVAETFRWRQLEVEADSQPIANEPARSDHPDAYVALAIASDGAGEIAGLLADIHHKLQQGYNYQDIAVLCRTRARASKITRALATAGLPVIEARGLLGQQHIKDLLSILLLVADKSGMGILRTAHQPEHSLSQSDLETLLLAARAQKCSPTLLIFRDEAPLRMSAEGRRSLSYLSQIMRSLLQYAPNVWSLLARYLFIETNMMRNLLQSSHDSYKQTLLSDYADFLQMARRYDQQQQALRTLQAQEAGLAKVPVPTIQEQVKGFIDYLQVMLSLGQDGSSRQQGIADDSAEQANVIRVMTVHASKGLEFPIVYLPGLISRNFPLQAHSNPVPAPTGMLPSNSDDKTIHESGEACLFYVGVTRARDFLILSYSERNGKQKAKASPYVDALLAALPPERLTHLHWQGYEGETPVSSMDEESDDSEIIPSIQPSRHFLEEVKPKKLKVSDIENYQRCPRRYLYGTLYGFASEESTYQLFWQAIQKTLEALQKQLAAVPVSQGIHSVSQAPTQEEARQLYMQYWQALGGPDLPFAHIYEQHGHEVTELIRSKLLATGDTSWELRPSFTVEAAGRTITVPVDRVEISTQRGQPVKFVRARFAKRNDKPAPGLRELLYAQVYRQQHGMTSLELHFHNLSTGETLPIKLTARKEQSLLEELEQAIEGLERNEYPAVPSAFVCPGCPFFLICPV